MGSSVTTWISCPCWSNFGGPDTSGKVHHGPKFSPFVDKNIPLKFSSLLLYIIYWGLANSKMLHYRHHLVWSVDQNVKKKRKERKSKKNNKKIYIKKTFKKSIIQIPPKQISLPLKKKGLITFTFQLLTK